MIKNYIDPELFQMLGATIVGGAIIIFFIKIYLVNKKYNNLRQSAE